MKEKNRNRCLAALFFITFAAVMAVGVYAGTVLQADSPRLDAGTVEECSDGWYYIDGENRVNIASLPATIEHEGGEVFTIYRALPQTLPEAAALCLESNHQVLEAFLGETRIYEYGVRNQTSPGWILGSVWNVIELPREAAGQVIALRFTSPYSLGECHVMGVQLGEKSAVFQQLWRSNMGVNSFVLLSSVLGLVFLVLSVMLKWKRVNFNQQGFFEIGMFTLLTTLWIVTDSKAIQFWNFNMAVIFLLSFFSFMLIPVPLLCFLRRLCGHGKRVFELFAVLFIANALLSMALYLTGIIDLVALLPITHVLMVFCIVIVFIILLRERFVYKNPETGFVLTGIFVLIFGALVSLLFFRPQTGSDSSLYFRWGLIGFYILLCYSSLRRGLNLMRDSLKTETYRALAYTDTMTGLGNRAAFDRDAETMQQRGGIKNVALAVFDINGLKHVNDTYGHVAGDELIKSAAHCIKEAFSELGVCYRIGGDEFVVIMPNASQNEAKAAMQRLMECTSKVSAGNPEGLSVADGLAVGESNEEDYIYQLFRQADKEMYEKKGKMRVKYR